MRVAQVLPAVAGGVPVRRDFLTFGSPLIGEEEIAEVVDTLRSGWIGFGPKCVRFEESFARYVGAANAVSLSSCTAALHLALVASQIGPGDEVITTPLTFSATVNAIELVGARPVFVDVDPITHNMDPGLVELAITSQTKAILPVHMEGRPCDMDRIGRIASEHGLTVIEDAAHAVEAAWNGRKIGSISHFTAFSFYATKNLTTGEGGMLTTEDPEVADRVRMLRLHGISKDAWARYSSAGFTPYDTVAPGFKYNLT
ncbi:MAG TPA: DegT/DnrJ/EryC1/StrS family aminotransferase, partial [Candidatus Dormibacteraeota bacterium]|nr:DegT/DnrJ/EryC1/StrS family aminotransferase [Candidatus Dormibacteraeota bacterium]